MSALRQVIEMAAQGVYPDGVLPSVLPGEVHRLCHCGLQFYVG
jgi:hypothetical protein